MSPLIGYILIGLCALLAALCVILLVRQGNQADAGQLERLRRDLEADQRAMRSELTESVQRNVQGLGNLLSENQRAADRAQNDRLLAIQRGMAEQSARMENRLKTSAVENEQKLENIRLTVEQRLAAMQGDNNKKLDEMRLIVDEKLQKTLNERMTQSFQLVNERLEQVYKGLGEMQTLAVGVGDLKKVLSGVKTRGTMGEIQLGAILSDMLAPEQYLTNVATVKNSDRRVEFAIKLPTEDGASILLPIDSKFALDAYSDLVDAYESAAPERIKAASDVLRARVRASAKEIRDKYISPPETTEFAVMFLPTEGLYAEVVRLGLMEQVQRDFRVTIAGPSTMAALLGSIQMGFRSVAIQKRSGEVWKVLSAVRTEFDRFEGVLVQAQKRINSVNEDLDKLVGVRTRQIRSRLRSVTAMPSDEVPLYLPDADNERDEPDDRPED